jgi:asparagine synthase (glutamine-hydrolysing)
MCGIALIAGPGLQQRKLERMISVQRHRGPDGEGVYLDSRHPVGLGHARLSILDLSDAGHQPMSCNQERLWISFNGEIYNYIELRQELSDYPFRSQTDTEVILAAFQRWGIACLDRLQGMFAFAIWDSKTQRLIVARDRFGVKPVYFSIQSGETLFVASEIKALHAAGIPAEPNEVMWSSFLANGLYDHSHATFWKHVQSLPAGHYLSWDKEHATVTQWYDLAESTGEELDSRPVEEVQEEYWSLLQDSVRKRFRADVPVGINLSGGLDSSVLLGIVQTVQGSESEVQAYTFATDDPRYDELPWVQQMLRHTKHPSTVCTLRIDEVPQLAESIQEFQDEPFGGLPTLAYAKIFEQARNDGVLVLLDGQGMDEQWAGYEYYARAVQTPTKETATYGPVQGARQRTTRPECLVPEFRDNNQSFSPSKPFRDELRNQQYRDTRYAKIPRALRFNDRISMRSSVELREPFLDHRLFELAFRQPASRKIVNGQGKWLLRKIARQSLPIEVVDAPKRPLQTPQREWLRDDLADWVENCIESALSSFGDEWFVKETVIREWNEYKKGDCDSSFHIWQWISVGLLTNLLRNRRRDQQFAVIES